MTSGQRLTADGRSWEDMQAAFRWDVPERFNIAEVCCDAWARTEPERLALRYVRPDGSERDYTYGQLARASRRLANALKSHGIGRGDRVAVLLPQTPETALTHLAAYRLGAIVVPLFTLFGEDGLLFRLGDSGAKAMVTDAANLPKVMSIRAQLPDLETIYSIDVREAGVDGFWQKLGKAEDECPIVETGPDDPAFISYTSGTTGPPKGALHGHRVLLGHMPGISLAHSGLGQEGDCLWTPADWAWMGGLTNVLLPGLYLGVPVVAHRMAKFDPVQAVELMRKTGVRNTFLPPTALKLMRQAGIESIPGLRSVASAGEALGAELLDWGREVFGITINEFYGQTECNVVLANCADLMPVKPGSAGKAAPGHEVAILSEEGEVLPPDTVGEIAVRAPNPVMFLKYWNNTLKTQEKFIGDWMLTGDEGEMDADGYVTFRSRTDDVITSSGYRIGPGEIEDCLVGHPQVAMAAVVGVPDEVRTEAVKAFIVLKQGIGSKTLRDELVERVRVRVSPHVAPRHLEFVETLPLTATGKIQRRALRDG
ncbi:AMP-binding protein [Amaricoccus tamworthensis]|uniref:AMP-binding protein n=1 Tax=Amaricoccus tamworthensis TaxID=57002 RepID=UPI003C7B1512